MADHFTIQTSLDLVTMTRMLHAAEAESVQLGLPSPQAGTKDLGPFTVTWEVDGAMREQSGEFVLNRPDAFGIKDVLLDYALKGTFSIDLNAFKLDIGSLPDLPTLPISINISNTLPLSGEVALHPHQNTEGSEWLIDVQPVDPFNLPIDAVTSFLTSLGEILTTALQKIPLLDALVGNFVKAILQTIGAEQVQDFLQPLLHPFVSGFTLYRLPSFISFTSPLPSPLQVGMQLTVQILDLSVVPNSEQNAVDLTWSGHIILKLIESGLSLALCGENSLQLHFPNKGLEEHLLSHVAYRRELTFSCDIALSTS